MTDTLYKWLNPNRMTTYQNVKWPKRVGVWTPNETPKLCKSGWHLATHEGIGEHARVGASLWIAEGRGQQDVQDDKIAFASARLVSEVGTLTHQMAVQWAAECAKRGLKHYEVQYPKDKRPRQAIQAALKWTKDPTEENAAYAANAAAYADDAAAYAADAAYAYAYDQTAKRRELADKLRELTGFNPLAATGKPGEGE